LKKKGENKSHDASSLINTMKQVLIWSQYNCKIFYLHDYSRLGWGEISGRSLLENSQPNQIWQYFSHRKKN
jgi:hypothetical protein